MAEIVRATAYCRDSGGNEQDLSIEQQVERITAFCRENGYALTRIFKDAARSGGQTRGREQFLDMVRYMEHSEETVLVIWSYSRFSRDYDDSQYYLALLRGFGKRIVSIADPIPDTLDGRVMESLVAWQHAKFRETLAKDVKRGMRYAITAHKGAHGKVPTGYMLVPVQVGLRRDGSAHMINQLQIDPEIGPLVTLAWQLRAEGYSYREIHQRVKLFDIIQNYSRMFRKEIYTGVLNWDGSRIEGYAPALTDEATFSKVQALNGENDAKAENRHPRRGHSSFLLSGLARCARCGNLMLGNSGKDRKGRRSAYYMCSSRNTSMDKHCGMRFLAEMKLDAQVMDRLKALFLDADSLQRLYELSSEEAGKLQETRHAEQEQHRRTLAELDRRIARLISAIEAAGHSEALIMELGKLEEERNQAVRKMSDYTAHQAPVEIPQIADMATFGAEAWAALERADKRKQQLLLRELVKEIMVDRVDDRTVGEIRLRSVPGLGEAGAVLQL